MLDEDSPFLELMPLAGWGQKDNPPIGGSVVAGIGLVWYSNSHPHKYSVLLFARYVLTLVRESGVLCMVSASVPTIKGGAVNKVTLAKGARLSEIAFLNRLPSINLTQSVSFYHHPANTHMQGIDVNCGSNLAGRSRS